MKWLVFLMKCKFWKQLITQILVVRDALLNLPRLSVEVDTDCKDFQICRARAVCVVFRQIKAIKVKVEGKLFMQVMLMVFVHIGRGGLLLAIRCALA